MIKVLIIDDSALTRKVLQKILEGDEQIQVVGVAADPIIAAKKLDKLNPDVITLDMEMPRMDGLTFLKKLMRQRPMPVVVISGVTEKASKSAIQALELGAVEVLEKPNISNPDQLYEVSDTITRAVKAAFQAEIKGCLKEKKSPLPLQVPASHNQSSIHEKLIVIGSSTGGPEALKNVLEGLDKECAGIVIAQHMPNLFTKSLADRLNDLCQIEVKQAEQFESLDPGKAVIIPGDFHGEVKKSDKGGYYLKLNQEDKVNRHRPSVDVLFESASLASGKNTIALILTGMGSDGANGMLKINQAGGMTIAQDEATCVVFGMPRKAIENGGAKQVYPIYQMSALINSFFNNSLETRS